MMFPPKCYLAGFVSLSQGKTKDFKQDISLCKKKF